VNKALADEEFRRYAQRDPKGALKSLGIEHNKLMLEAVEHFKLASKHLGRAFGEEDYDTTS
jgi:hypothetical protein